MLRTTIGVCKQSPRLAFTASSARCFASTAKKRRRIKSLRAAPKITTTRDRLRLLQETNLTNPKSLRERGEDLIEVAKGRFSWVKTKLFTYWNPDYKEDPVTGIASGAPDLATRRFRIDVVMDERWWFWHIVFALLPAFMIALYCETRGKWKMAYFEERQEIAQMKELMGEEWYEKHADVILAARAEERKNLNLTSDRIEQIFRDLYQILLQQLQELQAANKERSESSDQDEGEIKGQSPETSVSVPSSRRIRTPVTTAPNDELPNSMPSSAIKSDSSSPSPQPAIQSNALTSSEEPSVHALMQRIQLLEERLQLQQKEGEQRLDLKEIRPQLNQMNQSGIQSRMSNDLMKKWKKDLENAETAKTAPIEPIEAIATDDASLQATLLKMVRTLWDQNDATDTTSSNEPGVVPTNEESKVVALNKRELKPGTLPPVALDSAAPNAIAGSEEIVKTATTSAEGPKNSAEHASSLTSPSVPWWRRLWKA